MSNQKVVNETDVKPEDLGHHSTLGEVIECMKKHKLDNVDLDFDVSINFYWSKGFSLQELEKSLKDVGTNPTTDMEDWVETYNDIDNLTKTEHDIESFSLNGLSVNE